jgi:hypothetical protein
MFPKDKLESAQAAAKTAELQMMQILINHADCQSMTVQTIKDISATVGRIAFDACKDFDS